MRNICQCRKCKDVIESKHTHDFVRCKCGAIFTDGGPNYIRRGASDLNDIIDLEIKEYFKGQGEAFHLYYGCEEDDIVNVLSCTLETFPNDLEYIGQLSENIPLFKKMK